MENIICLIIGYCFGCASPAAWIARWKGVDLRRAGSGNLGGTNTMLVIGPKYGFAVMILDALKAVFAGMLAARIFPKLAAALTQKTFRLLARAAAKKGNSTAADMGAMKE